MWSSTEFCFLSDIPIAVIEMEGASALLICFNNSKKNITTFFQLFTNTSGLDFPSEKADNMPR